MNSQGFGKYLVRTFKALSLQLKRRKVVLGMFGAVAVFLVASGLVSAGLWYQRSREPLSYHLVLAAPHIIESKYFTSNKGQVEAVITQKGSRAFNLNKTPKLLLQATIADQEVLKSTLTFNNDETSKTIIIPLDLSTLSEQEHTLKVTVTEEQTSTLKDERVLVAANDLTLPKLLTVTSDKGSVSRYQLADDKNASPAAENGVKILTNTKGPLNMSWTFSENVTLDAPASPSGTFEITHAPATTHSAKVTLLEGRYQQPLSFQDKVGNRLKAELQFLFDSQAPKLQTASQYSLYPESKDTHVFRFTASEPMAFVKVTVNGVTKNASGSYKGFTVTGLPLTQEKNVVQLMGQDLAGNSTTAEVPITIIQHKPKSSSSFFNFGSPASLPANVRHCTEEDEKICGMVNVSDMSCEEFFVVKKCMKERCIRTGYYLGSCED